MAKSPVRSLGVAAFVGEISSGVSTVVFNFLILSLAGNEGVAGETGEKAYRKMNEEVVRGRQQNKPDVDPKT